MREATRTPFTLILVISCVVGLSGCEDDGTGMEPEEPEGPPTLSGEVQPIFTSSCAFNGCHGGSILEPPDKPMSLAAGQTRSNTVNVASLQAPDLDRIEPGRPDASYLVHKIQGTQGQVGGSGQRMPLGLPALTSGEIELIREWIADGARDN